MNNLTNIWAIHPHAKCNSGYYKSQVGLLCETHNNVFFYSWLCTASKHVNKPVLRKVRSTRWFSEFPVKLFFKNR